MCIKPTLMSTKYPANAGVKRFVIFLHIPSDSGFCSWRTGWFWRTVFIVSIFVRGCLNNFSHKSGLLCYSSNKQSTNEKQFTHVDITLPLFTIFQINLAPTLLKIEELVNLLKKCENSYGKSH